MWRDHLANAQPLLAESFFDKIINPYWDWCDRQHYLQLPTGNSERLAFWELLPYSYQAFPKAVKRATRLTPTSFNNIYLFSEEILKKDYSIRYPEEFTNFLLALIQADKNPLWNKDKWKKLWDSIKNSGVKKVVKLRDELARTKAIDD